VGEITGRIIDLTRWWQIRPYWAGWIGHTERPKGLEFGTVDDILVGLPHMLFMTIMGGSVRDGFLVKTFITKGSIVVEFMVIRVRRRDEVSL